MQIWHLNAWIYSMKIHKIAWKCDQMTSLKGSKNLAQLVNGTQYKNTSSHNSVVDHWFVVLLSRKPFRLKRRFEKNRPIFHLPLPALDLPLMDDELMDCQMYFLSLIYHGWVVLFLDTNYTVLIFRSWVDWADVALTFLIFILKIILSLQHYNHRVVDTISSEKRLKTKRRRSDPVLWQKPLYQQKCQRGKVTTQTPQKSSIKQQLRTDLGRSVGVTTATQLVWLTGLRAHLPTPRNSRVIKRTHI